MVELLAFGAAVLYVTSRQPGAAQDATASAFKTKAGGAVWSRQQTQPRTPPGNSWDGQQTQPTGRYTPPKPTPGPSSADVNACLTGAKYGLSIGAAAASPVFGIGAAAGAGIGAGVGCLSGLAIEHADDIGKAAQNLCWWCPPGPRGTG